ncbi:MAG: methyltransferase domain-containing protein [Gallionellaceae bacterium]|nr:methyltransferase domain-containing protein [Gallionellaceae bacterium]
MNDSNETRHLDLGCGVFPRNPLKCKKLYGCDIREMKTSPDELGFQYQRANLVRESIPFSDHYFNSVSAFDFIEHMPRQFVDANGALINPFVNLMSEIHRVLLPGGRFIAITPAYPRPEAFQDPTHVNIITDKTHTYFVGDDPYGAIYGFKGKFEVVDVYWSAPKNAHNLLEPRWRKSLRNFEHIVFKNGLSHILWDLKAV